MSAPFCGRKRLRRAAIGTPLLFDHPRRDRPLPPDIPNRETPEDYANRMFAEHTEDFTKLPQSCGNGVRSLVETESERAPAGARLAVAKMFAELSETLQRP